MITLREIPLKKNFVAGQYTIQLPSWLALGMQNG